MLFICFAILSAVTIEAASPIHVQTILHEDGSRTESRRNPHTKVLEEFQYGANKRLQRRKLFQLDGEGRALQGLVFDNKDNLIGRVEFAFDDLGRLLEERSLDSHSNLQHRILFRYDAKGKALQPMAFNYDEKQGGSTQAKPSGDPKISVPARSSLVTPGINNRALQKGERVVEGVPEGFRKVPGISLKGVRGK